MICSSCGQHSADTAPFCSGCGRPFATPGAANPPGGYQAGPAGGPPPPVPPAAQQPSYGPPGPQGTSPQGHYDQRIQAGPAGTYGQPAGPSPGPQAGFGPQGGYAQQSGYAQQTGYVQQSGYAQPNPQAGYGQPPAPGQYGPGAPYGQPAAHGQAAVVNTSGQNGEVPLELQGGWNWGAAFAPFWVLAHRVWPFFGLFVLLNLVDRGLTQGVGGSKPGLIALVLGELVVYGSLMAYLGTHGNALAWKHRRFDSVQHCQEVQNKWKPWGIVFFIVVLGFWGMSMLGVLAMLMGVA